MVKGDLIITQNDRIMTRSRARQSRHSTISYSRSTLTWHTDPDQYTIIHAPLKIIKVLVEELLSASGTARPMNPSASAAELDEEDSDDDDWEDDPDVLDLGMGTTKQGECASPG